MFEIFSELIIFSAIFSRMGDGKNSGKLLFRKLFSSDGFSITESENSLTFSSAAGSGSVIVNPYEIAYGTGTGVKSSSSFKVCIAPEKESFYGFGSIRAHKAIASKNLTISENSFIVGGSTNSIYANAKNSIILGGYKNSIDGGQLSTTIGGCGLQITCNSNTLIAGQSNRVSTWGDNSLILSGKGNNLQHSNSIIMSSTGSRMFTDNFNPNNDGSNFDSFNLISSSVVSDIINCAGFFRIGYSGVTRFNRIFSSNCSKIINSATTSVSGEFFTFSSPQTGFNNLISTNKSVIGNEFAYQGSAYFNNIISSECVCSYGLHNNILDSKCVIIQGTDNSSEKPSQGIFNQVISSYKICSFSNFSNIISSDESCDVSTPVTRLGYNNILASRLSKICSNSSFSTILSSRSVSLRGSNSAIISSAASCIGNNYSSDSTGLIISSGCSYIGAGTGSTMYNGIVISSAKSYNCTSNSETVVMISSLCNCSFETSTFISGRCNVSGFGLNNSVYGAFYNPGIGETMCDTGSWRGVGLRNIGSSHHIGGCKSKTTHSVNSVLLSTRCSILSNVRNTIIAGGYCNQIQAHGIFGTESENWFVLGQDPGSPFPTINLANRPLEFGINYYEIGCVQNNFIIGGQCNSFGSCIEKNYCSTYFNVGLTTSKSHYIYNSGIIGGYRNKIYNKSKILTEDWNGGDNPNNCIVNSVIIGGRDIVLSKSNTLAVQELITAHQSGDSPIRIFRNGNNYQSITGFWATVTNIKVINGIVVGVNV